MKLSFRASRAEKEQGLCIAVMPWSTDTFLLFDQSDKLSEKFLKEGQRTSLSNNSSNGIDYPPMATDVVLFVLNKRIDHQPVDSRLFLVRLSTDQSDLPPDGPTSYSR